MAMKTMQESLFGLVGELNRVFGEERVGSALSSVLGGVASAKATVDSNVESMLALANVPSRNELLRLQRKVDNLQRAVIGLTHKVDALALSVDRGKTRAASADHGSAKAASAARGVKKAAERKAGARAKKTDKRS